ncbi:uncharacterized protein LOC62_01G000927 [Vanrija pseudolonga]|uniref:Uncharacterized protein n=1 Tax=Vanrija pseudolonga TaxID=143232 RepID=A0AAF1BFE3_9TREE|nr:hypothetical protein LOC62_01G000927 [Vanrija pseudolonga]
MKPAVILLLVATALAMPIPKPDADAVAVAGPQTGWWHQNDGPLPLWKKIAAAEAEAEPEK